MTRVQKNILKMYRVLGFSSFLGFTLIEIVVSIAILGIIAGVIGPTLVSTVSHFALVSNRRATITEVKAAMDRMVIEMRQIPATTDITSCSTPTSFTFNTPGESGITYSLSGGFLKRGAANMVSSVSGLTFTCYDAAGFATTTVANAKRVGVEITVSPPNYGVLRVRTGVFMRRLATNYAGYQ